jgi:hypothetical protein
VQSDRAIAEGLRPKLDRVRLFAVLLSLFCFGLGVVFSIASRRTTPERSPLLWPWYQSATYGKGAAIAAVIYFAGSVGLAVAAASGLSGQ